MKNKFDQLMKYCFNELPPDALAEIEQQILQDNMTFEVVSGINRLRRRLGSKQAVEQYFQQSTNRVRRRLFPGNQ